MALLENLYEEPYLIALLYIARCCTTDQFSSVNLASLLNQAELNMKHLTSSGNSVANINDLVETLQKVVRYLLNFADSKFARINHFGN